MTSKFCLDDFEILTASVQLISWKRVKWHFFDRVINQFDGTPSTNILRIPSTFRRVDGYGRIDVDWPLYHRESILQWNNRRESIIPILHNKMMVERNLGLYAGTNLEHCYTCWRHQENNLTLITLNFSKKESWYVF